MDANICYLGWILRQGKKGLLGGDGFGETASYTSVLRDHKTTAADKPLWILKTYLVTWITAVETY